MIHIILNFNCLLIDRRASIEIISQGECWSVMHTNHPRILYLEFSFELIQQVSKDHFPFYRAGCQILPIFPKTEYQFQKSLHSAIQFSRRTQRNIDKVQVLISPFLHFSITPIPHFPIPSILHCSIAPLLQSPIPQLLQYSSGYEFEFLKIGDNLCCIFLEIAPFTIIYMKFGI
jgi:hypothetical protein